MINIWNNLRKGTGVIVCIPGDEHNGIQSKRPGIVLKTNTKYITVQLLSTTKSKHDIGITNINYKTDFSPHVLVEEKWNWMNSTMLFKQNSNVLHI